MNKIHKTVWSACKGAYVVVSENAKSKRMGSAGGGSLLTQGRTLAGRFVFTALSYSVLIAFAQPVFAKTMADYDASKDRACFYNPATSSVICGSDSTEVVPQYTASIRNVVLGHDARVKLGGTIAVGANAEAMSLGSIAIGDSASAGHQNPPGTPVSPAGFGAGNTGNIAIGDHAYAHGMTNISIGDWSGRDSIDNWNSNTVNIGTRANQGSVSGNNTIAIGNRAGALTRDGNDSVDQDLQAKQLAVPMSERTSNVYIGMHAGRRTVSYGNIALGQEAAKDIQDTRVSDNIAIGRGAGRGMSTDGEDIGYRFTGRNTLMGWSAGERLSGDGNLALGNFAGQALRGDANIALGHGAAANVTAKQSIIIGAEAGTITPTHTRNVLIGHRVNAGQRTEATAVERGVGIGYDAYVSGNDSVAIGSGARAGRPDRADLPGLSVNGAIAIGAAGARANNGIAIGYLAQTEGENSIVIGRDAFAPKEASIVIGASHALGGSSIAIGRATRTVENATSALAIGNTALVQKEEAIALGNSSVAGGTRSVAVGNSNRIHADKAVALGNDISVPEDLTGAVVLGDGSGAFAAVPTANVTINNVTYGDFAGATPAAGDIVSVGSVDAHRQIQNVAAGRISASSTDAINGSQLFHVADKVSENTANINKGINFGDASTTNKFALGDTIHVKGDSNVLSRTTADGVQLSLAHVLNVGDTHPVAINGTTGTIGGLTNTSFDPAATYAGGQAATQEQLQAVYNSISAVDNAWNLSANGSDSSRVDRGATVDFSAANNNIVVSKTDNNIKIKLADDLTATSVTTGNSTVNNEGLTITDGPSVTREGIAAGNKKITNVNAGEVSENSTDAVTGAQLHATSQNVAGNTAAIAGNTAAIATHTDTIAANAAAISNNTNAIGNLTDAVGKGWNLTANGEDSTKVEAGNTIDFSADGDKIVVKKTGNSIKIGLAQDLALTACLQVTRL